STAINGIFWYDPSIMPAIYKILRSRVFGMDGAEARAMMWKCFGSESEGMHASFKTHRDSIEAYKNYLSDFKYVNKVNREMAIMSRNSLQKHLETNRRELRTLFGKPQ